MVLTANVVRSNFIGIDASTLVSGTVPVSRGGSGVVTSTGTGNLVLSNAPMLANVNVTNTLYFGNVASNISLYAGNGAIVFGSGGTEQAQVTTQGIVLKNGSNVSPSLAFTGNTSVGLYLSSNVVTSSTNVQTPSGILTAMNTSTTITGSMPGFIHPIGCSVHTGNAAGVSTGIVTPGIAGFNASDVLAFYKNSAAIYDFWRTYINLAAGTYTFRLHAGKNTDRPIVTVVVGSTTVGTIDLYNASGVDAVSDLTGIVIASTGLYKVELQINTKNASSSAYYILWRGAAFIRTA